MPVDEIGRRQLPHAAPWAVDVSKEIFFLTICAKKREGGPLVSDGVGEKLIEAIRFNYEHGRWWIFVAVVMPDHVHLMARFPEEAKFVSSVRAWKHWTARHLGVEWQRDFFDHRLRREEDARETADYILQNPVRDGLVRDWRDWAHAWVNR
jgi:REP element-mobilizing transposase RayT